MIFKGKFSAITKFLRNFDSVSVEAGILVCLVLPMVFGQFFSRDDGKNAPRMGRRSDPLLSDSPLSDPLTSDSSLPRVPRPSQSNESMNKMVQVQDTGSNHASRLRKLMSGKLFSALVGMSTGTKDHNNNDFMLKGGIRGGGRTEYEPSDDFLPLF